MTKQTARRMVLTEAMIKKRKLNDEKMERAIEKRKAMELAKAAKVLEGGPKEKRVTRGSA
jgi:hypothetical protein